jgi:hypothetical protein
MATPFMKPASTGCGTKRARRPTRSSPSNTSSAPAVTTVAPVQASSRAPPAAVVGANVGSFNKDTTRVPRINAVLALGAAVGSWARLTSTITSAPTITLTTEAVSPICAAAAPAAPKTM